MLAREACCQVDSIENKENSCVYSSAGEGVRGGVDEHFVLFVTALLAYHIVLLPAGSDTHASRFTWCYVGCPSRVSMTLFCCVNDNNNLMCKCSLSSALSCLLRRASELSGRYVSHVYNFTNHSFCNVVLGPSNFSCHFGNKWHIQAVVAAIRVSICLTNV